MEKEVWRDITTILKQVVEILKIREEKDVLELKELSNHTIHDASIYQDIDSVEIAVITYALYKLLDRGVTISGSNYSRIVGEFSDALKMLQSNDFSAYNRHIQNLFIIVKKIDEKALMYIEEIIDKARINKGSKLFAHGLSAKRAAEIIGVSEWELLSYIGNTEIAGRDLPRRLDTKLRLNHALEVFNA